jgi:FkbM family methyltransferase
MIRILLILKHLFASLQIYLRIFAFRSKYKGIPYSKYSFFYKNLLRANELRQYGVKFSEENNQLVANFSANNTNVKLIIHSANDLGLIELVFVHRNYNFIPSQQINVIDIGMNIGDTCLYFASNLNIIKVWGYELCEPTYKIALKNFAVNPEISKKITPNCYGLGAKNEIIQIPFHIDFLGANGAFEKAGKHLFRGKGELLNCQVKNISEEFIKINSTLPILLKVDVEGSEYDIFREMDRTNSFNNVKYVMMEYHFGHQDLIEILHRNGFEVNEIFSSKNDNIDLGMIYASKSGKK